MRTTQEKTVGIEAVPEMQDFGAVAHRALTAARAGAKVLVVRNTVAYAVDTQRAVEAAADAVDRILLFDCGGALTLHHGRFAAGTAGCWTHGSRPCWARSADPAAASWSARRRWSSRSTSTPTC